MFVAMPAKGVWVSPEGRLLRFRGVDFVPVSSAAVLFGFGLLCYQVDCCVPVGSVPVSLLMYSRWLGFCAIVGLTPVLPQAGSALAFPWARLVCSCRLGSCVPVGSVALFQCARLMCSCGFRLLCYWVRAWLLCFCGRCSEQKKSSSSYIPRKSAGFKKFARVGELLFC